MINDTPTIVSLIKKALNSINPGSRWANDADIAEFLKMSPQALSNHKSKKSIPHKAILEICLFFKWPVEDLLTKGREDEFLQVAKMENKIYEDDSNCNFDEIIARIKGALNWIHDSFGEDYITIAGFISHTSIDDVYRDLLENMFYEDEAIKVMFPGSNLEDHKNPSGENEDISDELKKARERVKELTELELQEDFGMPSSTPAPRSIDLFELWNFTLGIDLYYRRVDTIDPVPEYLEEYKNTIGKYRDVYFLLGDPINTEPK
ncbi:MAG: hypothetical protein ACQ9MH_12955 [Nitrospinales bacterium]